MREEKKRIKEKTNKQEYEGTSRPGLRLSPKFCDEKILGDLDKKIFLKRDYKELFKLKKLIGFY